MKKTYQSPSTDMFSFRLESQLLGVSNITTTDPKDGGDPTGGKGSGTNPFGAKAVQLDQKDFNVWDDHTK
ncbi:aminotransferase [Hallella bergensis]|uniref:aminotransferase n=1 Tax=Hallella bergensis TaxID=242750 RepID=UPI0023F47C07|nr:aminotransferase [Hallella bergensis]